MTLVNRQKEEAIAYLRFKLSPDTLAAVYNHREDATWLERQHFGLGLAVRNILHARGFEEDDLDLVPHPGFGQRFDRVANRGYRRGQQGRHADQIRLVLLNRFDKLLRRDVGPICNCFT